MLTWSPLYIVGEGVVTEYKPPPTAEGGETTQFKNGYEKIAA